ncbi:MAG: hypothetical protein QM784_11040 [Polyangiaceae bacterium]
MRRANGRAARNEGWAKLVDGTFLVRAKKRIAEQRRGSDDVIVGKLRAEAKLVVLSRRHHWETAQKVGDGSVQRIESVEMLVGFGISCALPMNG